MTTSLLVGLSWAFAAQAVCWLMLFLRKVVRKQDVTLRESARVAAAAGLSALCYELAWYTSAGG